MCLSSGNLLSLLFMIVRQARKETSLIYCFEWKIETGLKLGKKQAEKKVQSYSVTFELIFLVFGIVKIYFEFDIKCKQTLML